MRSGMELFKYVNVRPVKTASDDDQQIFFYKPSEVVLENSRAYQKLKSLISMSAATRTSVRIKQTLDTVLTFVNRVLEPQESELTERIERVAALMKRVPNAEAVEELKAILPLEQRQSLLSKLYDRLLAYTLAFTIPKLETEVGVKYSFVRQAIQALHYLNLIETHEPSKVSLIQNLDDIAITIPKELAPLWQLQSNHSDGSASATSSATSGDDNTADEFTELYDFVKKLTDVIDDLQRTEERQEGGRERHKPYSDEFFTGLSPNTREYLEEIKWDYNMSFILPYVALDTFEIIDALKDERYREAKRVLTHMSPENLLEVRSTYQYQNLMKWVRIPFFEFGYLSRPSASSGTSSASISDAQRPLSGSAIRVLGQGDLLVVKERLVGNFRGEIAHIENVMKTEFKQRTHIREKETEMIRITSSEHEEETEKDLQSSERFQLQKEISKNQSRDMSLEAGLSVSSGFGPVKVQATADFALSESSSTSKNSSTDYAREMTVRSLSKIREQVSSEREARTLETVTEKNVHGFDNRPSKDHPEKGKQHIRGTYRWVDKEYKAYVVNYGLRTMVEGIVPEPAAFYRFVTSQRSISSDIGIEKPRAPMVSGEQLKPSDLTRENYMEFVEEYDVDLSEVGSYPLTFVRIADSIAYKVENESDSEPGNLAAETPDKITITKGYRPYFLYGKASVLGTGNLNVVIAGQVAYSYRGYGLEELSESENFEELQSVQFSSWGTPSRYSYDAPIPVSVYGVGKQCNVNFVIQCIVTKEHIEEWQLKAYTAIMEAYENALSEYQRTAAAAERSFGVEIEGRNPALNRKIEQGELKKGMLRLMTQGFVHVTDYFPYSNEHFDAMHDNVPPYGYPKFDLDEASKEGRIIQFFEQAFDWDNMTYRFNSYNWGREAKWAGTSLLEDPDPKFTAFLKAGAARINLPVSIGYNRAVAFYLATGAIFFGNEPPIIDSPLFVSLARELQGDTGNDIEDLERLPICADARINRVEDEGEPLWKSPWETKPSESIAAAPPIQRIPCLKDTYRYRLPTTLIALPEKGGAELSGSAIEGDSNDLRNG